ncbi:hypothetical protein [Acidovorax sp. Root219]|uniref:hypothetical protein n=1 Tax=Acidovorax sp. Root219 TaxID=1736493 RepID=UPI000ABEDFF8|nr:hypothetical protein [Acidovorax sp. Root219]
MRNLAVKHKCVGATVEIWLGDGHNPALIRDFSAAGFSPEVAEVMARAYVSLQGGNTLESQNANWILIKRFGKFISENYGYLRIFPVDVLSKYADHLEATVALKTAGAAYNTALRMLKWLVRNAPERVDKKIRLDRGHAASQAMASLTAREDAPDEVLVSQILRCCYEEIEAGEAAREKIRLLPLTENPDRFADFLLYLLMVGDGSIPTVKQMEAFPSGYNLKRVAQEFGGIREIFCQYYISIRELFPYYLAMLTQASANPQSFRQADMNCIMSVPFREDLERLVWDKKRSRRMQIPDFPKNKEWAAPNIARRLLAANSEMRHLAPLRYRNSLFICRTNGMNVSVPSWQSLHNCLSAFRAEHQLPHFSLTDLRRAGGVLHHRAGRSIASAQLRMQHRSSRVTQGYTPLEDLAAHHQEKIRIFQGWMLEEAKKTKLKKSASDPGLKTFESKAETLFGFQCKDPLAGIAEGSHIGVPCPKFHQCAGCPGTIVIIDDPHNVAKLVAAAKHLHSERERSLKEGWSKRFDLLYKPSLDVLRNEIFPVISKLVMDKAQSIPNIPFPSLE